MPYPAFFSSKKVKFLGTCIEPRPLKKVLLNAETNYLPCVYPDGDIPEDDAAAAAAAAALPGTAEGAAEGAAEVAAQPPV